MLKILRKYELDDLTSVKGSKNGNRSTIQIAVIDDESFPPLDELRRHKYNITFFNDIERICILDDFDIIITDIKGVGKHLGSSLEGAHLIEEMHKQFPNKYLIAYSASRFNMDLNKYFNMCDDQKKKDTDVNEWTITLDKAINCINDPIFQWEKTRQTLKKQQVSPHSISRLEIAYTKSVFKKDYKYLKKEITTNKSLAENPITKIAVESITAFTAKIISELINA